MHSKQKQIYCLGEQHKSNTYDVVEYEKINLETSKIVKVRKRNCGFCGQRKSQNFTESMIRGEVLKKLLEQTQFAYVSFSMVRFK